MSAIGHFLLPVLILVCCPTISVIPAKAAEQHKDTLAHVKVTVYHEAIVTDGGQTNALPISNAHVRLVVGKDTLAKATSAQGIAVFSDVPPGKATILITHVSFDSFGGLLDLVSGRNAVIIPLKQLPVSLTGAVVQAEVPPVIQHGDTLIFNAAAIRTMEDDNALEILRQMPGVEIRQGKVFIDGQQVMRTYVNGRLIFGDEPTAPLNAILAEDVTQIRSYNEASVEDRRRGAKHPRKERVLDIATKTPIVSAFDGHALASAGLDAASDEDGRHQLRYHSGVTANFFSEMFLAHATAYTNNISRKSNLFSDFLRTNNPLSAYNEDIVAGAGIEKYWGDRLFGNSFKIDYGFSHRKDLRKTHSRTDYFPTEESPERSITTWHSSDLRNALHNLSLGLNINSPDIKSLNIELNGSYQRGQDFIRDISETLQEGKRMDQDLHDDSTRDTWNLDGQIRWGDNDRPDALFPSAHVQFTLGYDNQASARVDTAATSFIRHNLSTDGLGFHAQVDAAGGIGIHLANDDRRTITLTPGIWVSYKHNNNRQVSLLLSDDTDPVIDPGNTFDFTSRYITAAPTINFSWDRGLNSFSFDFSPGLATVVDKERIPSAHGENRLFFAPNAKAILSFGGSNLATGVRTNLPSIEQFRSRVDDRNPLALRTGNPSIRPSYDWSLSGRLIVPLNNKRFSLAVSSNNTLTEGLIIPTQTFYLDGGILDGWMPYNVSPGAMVFSWTNASFAVTSDNRITLMARSQRLKTTFQAIAYYIFRLQPELICGQIIPLYDHTPLLSGDLDCRPSGKIRIRASASLQYCHSSTPQGQVLRSGFIPHMSGSAYFQTLRAIFLQLNYNWTGYRFTQEALPRSDIHRLGAIIGVRLLKGRLGISLSANDILNLGEYYSIQTGPNYTFQQWTPTYGRYYLLNLHFRFGRNNSGVHYQGTLDEGGEIDTSRFRPGI